jgi:hypothetical protein
LLPILLLFRVQTEQSIEEPFGRLCGGVQKSVPFSIEDADKVESDRFGKKQQNRRVQDELEPAVKVHEVHPPLELLGPQDREKQISDEKESDENSQNVGHLSEPFTSAGIKKASGEKDD